jgi:hypothetical protein
LEAASKLGKLEQSLHITQDGYALYELGENSITLSPNDMESIISSANQYAREFIIEFSRLSINPVSWSKPNFVGFKSPTASDGLFLSITLVLPVKMEYVYKRFPQRGQC